jgi:hypothetical protein
MRNRRSQHKSRALTPSKSKASLGASNHHPGIFSYIYIIIMILGCALGYRSWIDTLVALELLSNLSLLTLLLEIGH